MRYFVVFPGDAKQSPHVIAETIREPWDDGRYRDSSLAAAVAGPAMLVATEAELSKYEWGARALVRWRAQNDRDFDRGEPTEVRARGALHVVGHPQNHILDLIARARSVTMRAREAVDAARAVRRTIAMRRNGNQAIEEEHTHAG